MQSSKSWSQPDPFSTLHSQRRGHSSGSAKKRNEIGHNCDLDCSCMILTRRRQVFVAPLMWIFHSQVYTNTYAFMAMTEALSAVGGKPPFLAFVEIKGHHHLLKQKKEEMNLLFFHPVTSTRLYIHTWVM